MSREAGQFRPMLAPNESVQLENVKLPSFGSFKLDGIRATVRDGIALSRSLIPIRNRYVQKCLAGLPDGLDGELIVGAESGEGVFKRSTSGINSADGEPDFTFHVFDFVCDRPFAERYEEAASIVICADAPLKLVEHHLFTDLAALAAFEQRALDAKYEGVMLRDPAGPYKFNRATMNEGWLLKMKRFVDAEAVVIGAVEQTTNTNEAKLDERGLSKRSQAKAGKIGNGHLGAWECRLPSGVEFELGSAKGVSKAERARMWAERESYIGRIAKFKYQELSEDGVPRIPIFLGWRDPTDMSSP